jgi:aerobic-type carbon monoxide dehydrogenase small subunit (CoxS/CutS family)
MSHYQHKPPVDACKIEVNGVALEVAPGMTVAAAIALAGKWTFRKSRGGELRAPLCGMGICFECRVTVDGKPHQRSCQIICKDGMEICTDG